VGTLGVGIINSTALLLPSKDNSKIDGNQITFRAVDFQTHPPTLALVFASLDQEMDLMIRSFNFSVRSLGSVRLSDLINLGLLAGKIAVAPALETSVDSSSEINSPVSNKLTKESTVGKLDEIMENLDLEE
jgi:hypothetical protein